ncbi:MAG: cysteine desulfurase [Candidatus Obscuribacterales bacterium]|nr:cysteine desulfurase [Candidatus Obscuribacterales bacterium]
MINVEQIRKDFPILDRKINGHQLVYLDNAATSQKPLSVINAISDYYKNNNANIHRGIHTLSEEATTAYEDVRDKVAAFIGAKETKSIVFTRNATEAINLVAQTWGKTNILPGDEIVISAMEHHSNLIPWQWLAQERQAKLRFIELTPDGQLDMESAKSVINDKTKLVAVTQMSNVLGTITPIAELGKLAHAHGALLLVDGAQGVPHLPTNVEEMGADFLVFSFHKLLGPTGVGILWARPELLEAMPPFLGGGDMIASVWRDRATFNELPWKFEAGTPNIADVIGAGAAIDYLMALGMDKVRAHEVELTDYALKAFQTLDDVKIFGPMDAKLRGGVISFALDHIHPHDLGQILNESGIAIRAGHHCCQPLMRDLKVWGTARASFYLYNTKAEIDLLIEALKEANKVMGHVAYR